MVKIWGENRKRSVVTRMYTQHNIPTQQPNNNPTTQPNNPTTDATPNKTYDAINKNGGIMACVLEEGTIVGTNMQEANKNVAKDSKLRQEPLPSKSKSHGVIWASGGEEYDENYDVYEHLDKVPITMPPSLGPLDYMYYPHSSNVFYAIPQETNTPSRDPLLTSLTSGITENNPNMSKTSATDSLPLVPPSFQNSVITLAEEFLKLIPVEINEIVSNLPEGNRKKILMFICNLGVTPKVHIGQMTQEFQCQLQETQCQNAQQLVEIKTLNEQLKSLTAENAVMNTIIETQIPICREKCTTSTQTNSTPEIVVNEIVQKEWVSSGTQTLSVKAVDFSDQVNSCCKEHITSEFQCQVSLNTVPHLTQETQTPPVKSGDCWSQTNIPNPPKITEGSHNSFFQFENQQLKIELSQLQSEYSDLQELHENLDGKYQKALEYGAKANIQMEDQTDEIAQLKNQLVDLLENCKKITEHDNEICDKYNSLSIEFNTFLPQIKLANSTNLDLQKKVKGLQCDNYLLNNVLEKLSTDGNSKTICTNSSLQAKPTQNNINSSTQTNKVPPQKSLPPIKRTKNTPSRRTSPQPNIPISQIKITTNFKRFKCAWCSEEKHPWDKCQQWNSWNLWQKQQATQILENVKKGNLHPNVPVRPQFQPQRRALFSPIQVQRNNDSLSKIQWEKQMKINENVQEAGLVKVSNSFYVPQCSAVMQGVKSSSLRRGRTTPNSK